MITRHTSPRAFAFGVLATLVLHTGFSMQADQDASRADIVRLEPVVLHGKSLQAQAETAADTQIAQLPTVVLSGRRSRA